MCIIFFETHTENEREHYIGHYHCAHETCDGRFESHRKYSLQLPSTDCSVCLKKQETQVDPDVSPVSYYPPVEDFSVEHIGFGAGKNWFGRIVRCEGDEEPGVCLLGAVEGENERGGEEQDDGDSDDWHNYKNYKSLSDVDSVTSHWRLDEPEEHEHTATEIEESEHAVPEADNTPDAPTEDEASRPSSTDQNSYEPYKDSRLDEETQQPQTHHPSEDHTASCISTDTIRHRNLVNEQLAQLPHHISYARDHLQPIPENQQPHQWVQPQPAPRSPPPPGPRNPTAFFYYYMAKKVEWETQYIAMRQRRRNPEFVSMDTHNNGNGAPHWQGANAGYHQGDNMYNGLPQNNGMGWHSYY